MQSGRIWITGAGGLIGNNLVRSAAAFAPGLQIRPITRQDLQLGDSAATRELFHAENPAAVIHCAAIAKTPVCQADPALARLINVEVTAVLTSLCQQIPFVLFSTDLVFDGLKGNYSESDPINPLTVYARTKAEAESLVLANPRHTVIRTCLNGGVSPTGDRGFNEALRKSWHEGRVTNLFTDEFRTPIPAEVTARAVWELFRQDATGLFHLGGAERMSWWHMGQLLAQRWPELQPRLVPASIHRFQGAPRSPDTSLCSSKAQALLSFRLPGLSEWAQTRPKEQF